MKGQAKLEVEKAVHGISAAFGTLLKMIEKHAADISDADSEKLFSFLDHSLSVVEERGDHARSVAIVTRGTFSFDGDAPEEPKTRRARRSFKHSKEVAERNATPIAPYIPTVAHPTPPAQPTILPPRVRPEGRLASGSPDINPGIATAPVGPPVPMPSRSADDAEFMED